MTVVVKFSRKTYTLIVAILGGALTDLVPGIPEYFPGFHAFVGVVLGAAIAWFTTAEAETPA